LDAVANAVAQPKKRKARSRLIGRGLAKTAEPISNTSTDLLGVTVAGVAAIRTALLDVLKLNDPLRHVPAPNAALSTSTHANHRTASNTAANV
jgi:hypothetical protein